MRQRKAGEAKCLPVYLLGCPGDNREHTWTGLYYILTLEGVPKTHQVPAVIE